MTLPQESRFRVLLLLFCIFLSNDAGQINPSSDSSSSHQRDLKICRLSSTTNPSSCDYADHPTIIKNNNKGKSTTLEQQQRQKQRGQEVSNNSHNADDASGFHYQPLKIFILSEPSPITYMSGLSVRFQVLMEHLVEYYSQDEVHLITSERVYPKPLPVSCNNGKIPIHYMPGFQLPFYQGLTMSTGLLSTRKLWNLCSTGQQPDIIHVTSPGMLLFPAIVVSRINGIPLLMSYHTHLPIYVRTYVKPKTLSVVVEWFVWKMLKLIHSFADLTIVTSSQIATEFGRYDIKNVQLWPKGVDTTRFHPHHKNDGMRYRMSDGNPDDYLLVYIGRLAKEKRISDLKSILERLQSKGLPVRLCIVGHEPEMNTLKSQFGNTSKVKFIGTLSGLALSQAYASGDVFVMPSDSETLGFVVMESMASGVPVVGCEAGGLVDLIEDGNTGYLVPPGDTEGYVNRIESLLLETSTNNRNEIIQNARQATEQWSWKASMDFLRRDAYSQTRSNFYRKMRRQQGEATV